MTETLTFTAAHQTWSKEANTLEDRLRFGAIDGHAEERGSAVAVRGPGSAMLFGAPAGHRERS